MFGNGICKEQVYVKSKAGDKFQTQHLKLHIMHILIVKEH